MSKLILRCAVYTRVSSDQGLEQDFNSLDAQREAAEAYIKSQAQEGWKPLRDHFDDGGYSGGTMERPALQRLLNVIRSGQIDVVVVYKVDRLTRSLADFAKLVELFDTHKVSFVSVMVDARHSCAGPSTVRILAKPQRLPEGLVIREPQGASGAIFAIELLKREGEQRQSVRTRAFLYVFQEALRELRLDDELAAGLRQAPQRAFDDFLIGAARHRQQRHGGLRHALQSLGVLQRVV